MKFLRTVAAVLFCLLALSPSAFSQLAAPEADVSVAVVAAQQQYGRSFNGLPQLFNGPEYADYAKNYRERNGFQFFMWPEKQLGSVDYNGYTFPGVRLAYDVVLDQVVLSPANSPLALRLINERVRAFSIADHRFVRLVADRSTSNVIGTGFYELLLDSTVQVVAKRAKRLQEHIVQQYIAVEFVPNDRLFIKKEGRYYPVASKSSALHLLADRSKEMQKYLQERKLKFNKAKREASIVQLATYYCSLPPR
ncbi:hypothetical protein [Hymenobacter terricola]|uniref:hypothetical protein n=1 Tax=Hymenobacter terricola TaxID=2819236 RepID=UPI001B315CF9|nr:hypothetical protein [Hymenobacter terricola]